MNKESIKECVDRLEDRLYTRSEVAAIIVDVGAIVLDIERRRIREWLDMFMFTNQ